MAIQSEITVDYRRYLLWPLFVLLLTLCGIELSVGVIPDELLLLSGLYLVGAAARFGPLRWWRYLLDIFFIMIGMCVIFEIRHESLWRELVSVGAVMLASLVCCSAGLALGLETIIITALMFTVLLVTTHIALPFSPLLTLALFLALGRRYGFRCLLPVAPQSADVAPYIALSATWTRLKKVLLVTGIVFYVGATLKIWHSHKIEKEVNEWMSRIAWENSAAGMAQLAPDYEKFIELQRSYLKVISDFERGYGPESREVAYVLRNLAGLYCHTGRYSDAEPLYKRALAILKDDDAHIYAKTVSNLAEIYSITARYAEAESLYKDVLDFDEKTLGAGHADVAPILTNLAGVYCHTGRYSEAEPLYKRALAIGEKTLGANHPDVAQMLNKLAELYTTIARYSEAEPLFKRALAIDEKALRPDHPTVAGILSNLARVYYHTGRYAEAEQLLKRTLDMGEKNLGASHPNVATWLNNLAELYSNTNRYSAAEPLYKRAIAIDKKIFGADHPTVANKLSNLAKLYYCTGRYSQAEPLFKRVLRIASSAGDPDLLRIAQSDYSFLLENQHHAEAAIFFGKQAVNTIQGMRQNIVGLGKTTLKGFDDTVESDYRRLSRLLVAQGRLSEAERVLELLKEQEHFQFVRRTATTAMGQAPMTSLESAQDRLLAEAGKPLASMFAEQQSLEDKKVRMADEEARYKQLSAQLETANAAFMQLLNQVVAKLSVARADKGVDLNEADALQETLRELGARTVALYTIVEPESYTLILITPDYRRAYITKLKGIDLNAKINDFRVILKNPALDPRPLGRELLEIILPAAARKELAQFHALTLMWHLDGPLRYLPLGALYDGNRYLVENYRTTLFTSASKANIKDHPKVHWQGLGLGVSKPRTVEKRAFGALPSVPGELSTVIRSKGAGGAGVIAGELYLDPDFTWDLMLEKLKRKGRYSLVHIASHFFLEPGNDTHSFLLPGGGVPITMALIAKQNNLFGGVDLLTLSACETGLGGGKTADGREVDGLSILAQQKGAKAVIATLWPVADDSTSLLMQQFYRLRESGQLPKGEALRQAQLSLLNGKAIATAEMVKRSALRLGHEPQKAVAGAKPFTADPTRPYAHPYFWAPFVLMGNWL